jgi:predicted dehydrogenase
MMKEFRIGTVGCGGFALFSLEQFSTIPGVSLVALAEPNEAAAEKAMRKFQLPKPESVESLCARSDEMLVTAADHGRVMVANLMQRYNPLADAVKSVIKRGVLGETLHGYFENYAACAMAKPF